MHGSYHITDIAWYKDKLYLVTNTTHVYWYNLTTHDTGHLREMDSVGSIAVDWIGRKLYWSNPKQQLVCISRSQKWIFLLANWIQLASVKM